MSAPLTPKQSRNNYVPDIPDFLIDKVNKLIQEKFNQKSQKETSVNIKFKEVKSLMINTISNYNDEFGANYSFKSHYLDIENVYRKAGWDIEVDKPGYNESYEGSWTFKR